MKSLPVRLLFSYLMIRNTQIDPKNELSEITDTIDLLLEGDEAIEIYNAYRDLVFLVGDQRSGKSTLALFAGGQLSDLESKDNDDADDFLIESRTYDWINHEPPDVDDTAVYPNFIVDADEVAFYNCTALNSKSMNHEIAGKFFLKKIVDHSRSLKFVLVANYRSVADVHSTDDFNELVKHFHSFMKHISPYKDAISLVVTKVDPGASSENVIDKIADFLQTFRVQLNSKSHSEFVRFATFLVDIFLTKSSKGQGYAKISIFRAPNASGPLNKIRYMVDDRKRIRDMIINGTKYAKIASNDDFAFPITRSSILQLLSLVDKLNSEIRKRIHKIGDVIESEVQSEVQRLGNLKQMAMRFEEMHSLITGISKINDKVSADSIVIALTDLAKDMKVTISLELFDSIQQLESYVNFLEYFAPDSKENPSEPMDGLKDCISILEWLKNWFKFLSDIYERYSEYDFRVDISKYNVKNITNWGSIGKTPGIYITQDNFWDFVEKQTFTTLPSYENFPNEPELQLLNDLLEITLNDTIDIVCDKQNARLIVKGHYVRLTQVESIDCGFDVKLQLIFASHTIFIDMNSTTTANMQIVAPKWYVVGTSLISMHGLNGKDFHSKQLNDTQNGQPGLPGEPGPSFAGYGRDFINHLTVQSVGGNGGVGQEGGRGKDGSDPPVNLLMSRFLSCELAIRNNSFLASHYQFISHPCAHTEACTTQFDFFGTCAKLPGVGGRGGTGGFPGDIKIFELARESNISNGITRILKAGSDGSDGRDGAVARKQCLTIRMSCRPYLFSFWKRINSRVATHCPTIGNRSKNSQGMVKPANAPTIDSSFYLSDYLAFMRESQSQKLKKDDVLSFVDLIVSDETVIANYTINALVNEYLVLESQYFRLKDQIELQSYYHSFASKIGTIMTKFKPKSSVDLKVISYLYTAAWGKYVAMKTQPLLIIDVQSYLDLTIGIIEKLSKAERQQIIDDRKNQYKDQILSKIEDANALIKDEILPIIEDIKKELNSNMQSLVEEIVQMQQAIEQDIAKYQDQLVKVKQKMRAHIFFGVLGTIGTFLSCLGPYGMAAGMVVSGISLIGESFVDTTSPVQGATKIPAGVKTAIEGVKEFVIARREEKIKSLNQQLEHYTKRLSELGDDFQDTTKEMERMANNLKNLKNFQDIDDAKKEVKRLIEEKESLLKKDPAKYGKKALQVTKAISNGITVAEASMEVFNQYKDDENELDTIRKAIQESEDNMKALKDFERNVYSDVWPMLTDMLADIDEIQATPSNSHISIDWKKYRIQSWLRDTKFQMHKLTKGFEMEEDILQTIQKLDDIYLTLLNIYDHIEVYKDQAQFGNFVADIMSTSVESVQVDDPNLNSALRRTDVAINSNILLKQFKLAVDAFKHTVFPFANHYLKYYQLPTNLQADDFSMLLTKVSNQLNELRTKYREYNTASINENDEYIVEAMFTNDLDSSEPFYEWRSENHGKMIGNLLSGKMVKIRADIQQGVALNAVKFSLIKLVIGSSIPSQQNQLAKRLLNFDVTMKHMGNSYYRCGSSYYMIHSPVTSIEYSNQEVNGVPIRRNNVYTKFLQGDILLSPYALWTIQLEYHGKGGAKTEFEKLKHLARGTNLYLVGKGLYVKNNVPICKTKPQDYRDFEIEI